MSLWWRLLLLELLLVLLPLVPAKMHQVSQQRGVWPIPLWAPQVL
jgi:hypothetical protein